MMHTWQASNLPPPNTPVSGVLHVQVTAVLVYSLPSCIGWPAM
jgi:hypothetical protein